MILATAAQPVELAADGDSSATSGWPFLSQAPEADGGADAGSPTLVQIAWYDDGGSSATSVHRLGVVARIDLQALTAPATVNVSGAGPLALWWRSLSYGCDGQGHCAAQGTNDDAQATGPLACELTASTVACHFTNVAMSTPGPGLSGWFHAARP